MSETLRRPSRVDATDAKKKGRFRRVLSPVVVYYENFVKQDLRAWLSPVPSLRYSAGFFFLLTVLTIPLGAALFWQTLKNTEVILRYDNFGLEDSASTLTNQDRRAIVTDRNRTPVVLRYDIPIKETLERPVYVYYELTGFYQNHKRYVRSQNARQLGGEKPNVASMSECDPYRYAPRRSTSSPDEERQVIVPCGLVAHSLFNDSFVLDGGFDEAGIDLELIMEETGIATEWDRKYLYGDVEPQFFNNVPHLSGGGQIEGKLDEDEHFMVWMRVGSRPTVRKLYGIIHKDIPKGSNLTFNITHRYNTYDFNGKKKLVLTTSNWTGGRNEFTGIVYFVIGSASAVACIFILLLDLRSNRRHGDLRALSWNKHR